MHFSIVTLFPDFFSALDYGIVGRAFQKKLATLSLWNPRDYSDRPHGYVDDTPYGGGPGMVLQAPPLQRAIRAAHHAAPHPSLRIYLSPTGIPLNQTHLTKLQKYNHLTLLCGRYEGIDQRVIDSDIDQEYSIGDYVISGGEPAALVLIDALIRQHPDALGDSDSAVQDSFYQGLLDHPHYTRPKTVENCTVPDILLSGDHSQIAHWRQKQAETITQKRRPDLWQAYLSRRKK